jgi:ATP-dependent DNA helicase RecG
MATQHGDFLSQPVTALAGVGPKKAVRLKTLRIETVGDLLHHYPRRYEDRRNARRIADLFPNGSGGFGAADAEDAAGGALGVAGSGASDAPGRSGSAGATDGESVLVRAHVESVSIPPYSARKLTRAPMKVRVGDGSGVMQLIFFNYQYLKNAFETGREYLFYGSVRRESGGLTMVHPDFEPADGKNAASGFGIVPVYGLTAGIVQKYLRGLVRQALDACAYAHGADGADSSLGVGIGGRFGSDGMGTGSADSMEILPESVARQNKLAPAGYALAHIHFPANEQTFRAARYRLVFEELFLLQAGLLRIRKRQARESDGIVFADFPADVFAAVLPFEMTGAQKRATEEIYADMERPVAMHRLLQGDVGSGKTAVAMAACFKAAGSGYQSVLMAPTEILAAQHHAEFSRVLGKASRVGFLAAGLAPKEKSSVKERLKAGEIDILIGTHAVIEQDVAFARLGLVVTDEQHRFGVNQRLRLQEKGAVPDVLVMTATPIPRTLAMILYGDLDVSVLDEMPPGRKPVTTRFVGSEKREPVYDFAEKQMRKGRQVFVVAPQIEEDEFNNNNNNNNETEDRSEAGWGASSANRSEGAPHAPSAALRSAEGLAAELGTRFPAFRVGMLHGAMKQAEKDCVMRDFADKTIDMLVCTVVVEVGINVPNATMMIVENAERFGLAQLHQLRGRVGRGAEKSFCVLISDSRSELARKRGETLEATNDGFRIAEIDLELRGPGDLFGVRQHGLPELKIADLAKHLRVVRIVNREATALFQADPFLDAPENARLRDALDRLGEGHSA